MNIIVVANQGDKIIKFDDLNITTWGELKQKINEYNEGRNASAINFNNVEAVLGGTQQSLNIDTALLPQEATVRVFLMQKESKSGGLGEDRALAYTKIRAFIELHGEDAKEYFNSQLHYTNKRTSLLWDMINAYSNDDVATPVASGFNYAAVSAAIENLTELVEEYGDDDEIEAFNVLKEQLLTSNMTEEERAERAELKEAYCQIAEASDHLTDCD